MFINIQIDISINGNQQGTITNHLGWLDEEEPWLSKAAFCLPNFSE
jgi:hypothetical protein